jgi:hypothetical protein
MERNGKLPLNKLLATILFEKKQRSSIIAIEILTKELRKNYKKKMLSNRKADNYKFMVGHRG